MHKLYLDTPSNRNKLNEWERKALEKFSQKMSDKKKPFPCIPATIGYVKNQLRYGFIGDPLENESSHKLAELMMQYTKESKTFGSYTSLVIFYHTSEDIKNTYKVEDYEQLFWNQLSGLSSLDSTDWPEDIPQNPHHSIWEFCFNGEKYFMYCATPAHVNRQSRHFDVMMLAITPRWVLEEFNKKGSFANKIKENVRKRLENYDLAPVHPDLKNYGADDNFEWKQYFLRDDDTSISQCPYQRMIKLFKLDK